MKCNGEGYGEILFETMTAVHYLYIVMTKSLHSPLQNNDRNLSVSEWKDECSLILHGASEAYWRVVNFTQVLLGVTT